MRPRFNTGVGEVLFNSAANWMRIFGVALAKLLTMRFLLHAFGTPGLLTIIISLITSVPSAFFLGRNQSVRQQLKFLFLSWKTAQ